MEREAAPEPLTVAIGCISQRPCFGTPMQRCFRRTPEGDRTVVMARGYFHFWEFNEIWEVFAKGGDREGEEGR